ncbi:MAG: ABC transporter substrate-binding protein [Bacteroidales bacterium]|nr:ABC transporter substrate-binding protein [Bacteroidales bacterium]
MFNHSSLRPFLCSLISGTVVLSLIACGARSSGISPSSADEMGDSLTLSYARGFTVRTIADGIRLVDVADPQTDEDRMPVSYHYALIPKSFEGAPSVPEGYTPVRVPVERTIVMTMLQLSNFTTLGALDVVRGITGTKNLYNKDVHARVADGRIAKIGMEGNFDTELILAAQPEVIFISPFKRGGYDAIKETGITLIPHLGYKELTPLGQAEWLKFVGLFIGREHEADSLFAGIESRYNALKMKTEALTADGENRLPTVFSGEMHGGNWYAVGGRNSLAQLFRDAGADYVIKDDNTGGVNIEFEQLYATAANADYWRILNSFPGDFSYEALKASEPRNELFRAFREHKVIYCNMKQTPYYELSPVQPDVLLADLLAIFHPELMPADYQPTFYRLLP